MPAPPEPSRPPAGSTEEALRRLEARLDRASEAAERLMAQAAEAAGGGGAAFGGARGAGDPAGPGGAGDPGGAYAGDPVKPPPSGWQVPEDAAAPPDLDPLVGLIQAMRDLVPPELQRRLVVALRELLLAVRALIDWYLERLEQRREHVSEIQDIPIL